MADHFFVTGGLGCIGSWVVANLVEQGAEVTVFDDSDWIHRMELTMGKDATSKFNRINGDVTNGDAFSSEVKNSGASHLIHLAAFQVPFCKAQPARGAAVNVEGTVNAFEAAKANGIDHVCYASSVAVFGRHDEYETRLLANDAMLRPHTLYGAYKQANEETARIYFQDHGITSFALRPYTVYGPSRDLGMTSSPTTAILSAIKGDDYEITYGGENGFQFVDDIAKLFVMGARKKTDGPVAVNVSGQIASMAEVVAAINEAIPESAGKITFKDSPLALPAGQDDSALRAVLGDIPDTNLKDGVARSVELFRKAIAEDRLVLAG